jgi:FkbM family methyltransferase
MNFIQIGSNIGASENDVIWNLMKEKKWVGVLVEPVPESFKRLVENYKSIEGCFFENSAIADYDGEIKIYSRKDYKNKSQQASINKNHWGNDKYDEVNCLKLESLVAKYNMLNKEFDLLQIDAEGADDLILLNCDFKNVKPKEIRFESVHLRGGRLNKVLQHLKKCGYEKTKDNYLKYVKAFPGYEHYDTVVKKIN